MDFSSSSPFCSISSFLSSLFRVVRQTKFASWILNCEYRSEHSEIYTYINIESIILNGFNGTDRTGDLYNKISMPFAFSRFIYLFSAPAPSITHAWWSLLCFEYIIRFVIIIYSFVMRRSGCHFRRHRRRHVVMEAYRKSVHCVTPLSGLGLWSG